LLVFNDEINAASTKRGSNILCTILKIVTAKDTNVRITGLSNLERFIERTFMPFVSRCTAIESLGGSIGGVLVKVHRLGNLTTCGRRNEDSSQDGGKSQSGGRQLDDHFGRA
jgi:hypothetical protein